VRFYNIVVLKIGCAGGRGSFWRVVYLPGVVCVIAWHLAVGLGVNGGR